MSQVTLLPGYWQTCQKINAEQAIYHQWEQLVASGCIENFRIAAGESDAFREGWFFADSDAFKWLDAAARISASQPDARLTALMDEFIALIGRAQAADGYLYTYNQIHFPHTRWVNLQIEHELYCHGHLIEAGVSHYEATGRRDLLEIVLRAADRIAADFNGKGPLYTPGHEEIEIALIRLYRTTQRKAYLELARQFLEQRGQQKGIAFSVFQQNASAEQRKKMVQQQRLVHTQNHPETKPFQVPAGNEAKQPANIQVRWMVNALSGKYFQQHAPIRKQRVPVGHSVRFAYLETAAAMLARESGESAMRQTLEQVWEHMIARRMYVTGGIGSLPALEGFGRDYELDPEFAYAETCAALGSMFWNWEMTQLTGQARYADCFEWQLYNASRVGMGADGTRYFYNNPLACRGGVTRKTWYEIPCCPSNISRTWADLGTYLFSQDEHNLWIHQYVSSEAILESCGALHLKLQSGLPWQGKVRIELTPPTARTFTLQLRIPSWADGTTMRINQGEAIRIPAQPSGSEPSASGYDPRTSHYYPIDRTWEPGDTLELEFHLAIRLRQAHPKVKGHTGKVALTAGPLVYCLESIDNPALDLFSLRLDTASLAFAFEGDLLGGTNVITARTQDGEPLKFIPYHLWGNRGASQMTVWVNT